VRPDHLAVGTQAQNVADTVRRGRRTSHAKSGSRAWRELSYARQVARDRGGELIAELLRRLLHLEPFGAVASTVNRITVGSVSDR